MMDRPAVLVLVRDGVERGNIERDLRAMAVVPVAVRAAGAHAALAHYKPVAVVLDDDHAATAPDAFVSESLARGVRLVAMPAALARPLRSQMLRDVLREARQTYDESAR